jgi:hypothetical protein
MAGPSCVREAHARPCGPGKGGQGSPGTRACPCGWKEEVSLGPPHVVPRCQALPEGPRYFEFWILAREEQMERTLHVGALPESTSASGGEERRR